MVAFLLLTRNKNMNISGWVSMKSVKDIPRHSHHLERQTSNSVTTLKAMLYLSHGVRRPTPSGLDRVTTREAGSMRTFCRLLLSDRHNKQGSQTAGVLLRESHGYTRGMVTWWAVDGQNMDTITGQRTDWMRILYLRSVYGREIILPVVARTVNYLTLASCLIYS